jgi:hypothetical protein
MKSKPIPPETFNNIKEAFRYSIDNAHAEVLLAARQVKKASMNLDSKVKVVQNLNCVIADLLSEPTSPSFTEKAILTWVSNIVLKHTITIGSVRLTKNPDDSTRFLVRVRYEKPDEFYASDDVDKDRAFFHQAVVLLDKYLWHIKPSAGSNILQRWDDSCRLNHGAYYLEVLKVNWFSVAGTRKSPITKHKI